MGMSRTWNSPLTTRMEEYAGRRGVGSWVFQTVPKNNDRPPLLGHGFGGRLRSVPRGVGLCALHVERHIHHGKLLPRGDVAVHVFVDGHQVLGVSLRSHGDHQPPGARELVNQRLWDPRGSSAHVDGVEGPFLGPALASVCRLEREVVGVAEPLLLPICNQVPFTHGDELGNEFDTEGATRRSSLGDHRHHGRSEIARAGPTVQRTHPRCEVRLEELQAGRMHVGGTDGYTVTDARRGVDVQLRFVNNVVAPIQGPERPFDPPLFHHTILDQVVHQRRITCRTTPPHFVLFLFTSTASRCL
eukprot:Hpha_TRINITY_DN16411_c1_g1::TRINITY_DN16411_c1_g1_i3::g.161514::m.161514